MKGQPAKQKNTWSPVRLHCVTATGLDADDEVCVLPEQLQQQQQHQHHLCSPAAAAAASEARIRIAYSN
eukprot:1151649-Pelagomonas_calceolata.AAC.2